MAGARLLVNEQWFTGKWIGKRRPLVDGIRYCGAQLEFAQWPYFLYRCPDAGERVGAPACISGRVVPGCRVVTPRCEGRRPPPTARPA